MQQAHEAALKVVKAVAMMMVIVVVIIAVMMIMMVEMMSGLRPQTHYKRQDEPAPTSPNAPP